MFAVIKTGGKQYRVAAEDTLKIDRVEGEVGQIVEIGRVLAHGEGDKVTIGSPFVEDATVTGEVVEQGRGPKVIAFKKRRRQNSRRTRGHRQLLTTVRISEILIGGAKPSRKAAAPKTVEAKPAAKAEEASARKVEPKEEAKAPAKKAEPQEEVKAAPLFKAPRGKGDDLTVIKGIGPVAAKDLNEQGITTFAQIAALTDEEITEIDAAMPFSTAQIEDWREQAKTLAAEKK
ncbi:MAG: 50S ribosomal protein L21 [Hyphomicrobiales bacterium]|nr:50S ribosomal protein L21 [Hyphomicrobiales bacterium]